MLRMLISVCFCILSFFILFKLELDSVEQTSARYKQCRKYQSAIEAMRDIQTRQSEPATFVIFGAALNKCIYLTNLDREIVSDSIRILRIGWPQHSPSFHKNLEILGIDHSTPGLFKQKQLYFICGLDFLNLLSEYAQIHYGFSIENQLIYQIDDVTIFRVNSKEEKGK